MLKKTVILGEGCTFGKLLVCAFMKSEESGGEGERGRSNTIACNNVDTIVNNNRDTMTGKR